MQLPAILARRALLLAALATVPLAQSGAQLGPWTATWGAAPAGPPDAAHMQVFANQTLRLVVHASTGGKRVRIRVSNEMGSAPLRIGAAHIGIRTGGADVAPGSDRVLAFSGNASIVIPPGAPALSDPVELAVPPFTDLAVSLYLPGPVDASTVHNLAMQTQYVSPPGDFTAAATLPLQATITTLPFLTEVDVEAPGGSVVALGDSITDGFRGKADANHRWPDWLAQRLQGSTGVVNRGISANRLLADPAEGSLAGRSVLERFDRDVLATSGVRYLTLMIGINDIGARSDADPVSAGAIIAGYRQVIARAHARGIAVYGATLTPFEGAGYYAPEKEAVRQEVNAWLRARGNTDAVIDFDRATRDPAHPGRFLPAYDSGDHLHPNDAGYRAMGEAVPLALFDPAPAPH